MKKHPLQNRTNVQIKGGGGQRPFEQCSKKLHFFETKASLITVKYKISSDHDDCLGGPAEEVFGHLEILQLHRGPTSDEHTEHLIRNSQVRSVAKLRLDHTQHHDCVTSIPIHDEELNILNQSNFHPCKMISLALT